MYHQLELFTPDRLPRKPYCADDFAHGVQIRSLKQALSCPYIQINPPHLRFWLVFDIDREDGAAAWIDADLPCPAWTTQNVANGHAHTAWGLSAPVLIGNNARNAPLRYLAALEAAYCALLRADEDYSGLITKNPLHRQWRLLMGTNKLYTLQELAGNLDLGSLRKYRPRREADAPQIGVGRNCFIFDLTRDWAYRRFREYVCSDYYTWQAAVEARACSYNGDLRTPLHYNEVMHIVKSVAKWIWRHYDITTADMRFAAIQAQRGRKGGIASGIARGERNRHLQELAFELLSEGQTQQKTAEICGVTRMTISRWIRAKKTGEKLE